MSGKTDSAATVFISRDDAEEEADKTKAAKDESDDSDKSKDKRVKKGKDGRKDSKIKKKYQKKRNKKKGKKGKSKKAKSASSSRGSAGMEEAEAAPEGGKGDGKVKDGDGKQASKQGMPGLQRRQRRRERWWPLPSGACRELSSLLSFSITSHRTGMWIGLTAKSSSRKSTKYQSRC